MLRHSIVTALAVVMVACGSSAPPPPADESQARAAIAETQRAWSDALVRNDVDSLLSLYTEDALILPPGYQFRGPEEIRGWFTQDTSWHNIGHATEVHDLAIYDSVAVEFGTWRSTWRISDGPEQSAADRYLMVWKRGADGRWRIQYDMWHVPAADSAQP